MGSPAPSQISKFNACDKFASSHLNEGSPPTVCRWGNQPMKIVRDKLIMQEAVSAQTAEVTAKKMPQVAQTAKTIAKAQQQVCVSGRSSKRTRKKITLEDLESGSSQRTARGGIDQKTNPFEHETAVFAAYIGNDARAITRLAIADHLHMDPRKLKTRGFQLDAALTDPTFEFRLTCFNYEPLEELIEDFSGTKELRDLERNQRFNDYLTEKSDGRVGWDIEYKKVKNDLNDGKISSWNKEDRTYNETMVFFNPYAEPPGTEGSRSWGAGTRRLMDSFFAYAASNLKDGGVVILMWNPLRTDGVDVNVPKTAVSHGFRIMDMRSGLDFHNLTGFEHLQNASSGEKSRNRGDSRKVDPKSRDTIIIFQKATDMSSPRVARTATKVAALFQKYLGNPSRKCAILLRTQETNAIKSEMAKIVEVDADGFTKVKKGGRYCS